MSYQYFGPVKTQVNGNTTASFDGNSDLDMKGNRVIA